MPLRPRRAAQRPRCPLPACRGNPSGFPCGQAATQHAGSSWTRDPGLWMPSTAEARLSSPSGVSFPSILHGTHLCGARGWVRLCRRGGQRVPWGTDGPRWGFTRQPRPDPPSLPRRSRSGHGQPPAPAPPAPQLRDPSARAQAASATSPALLARSFHVVDLFLVFNDGLFGEKEEVAFVSKVGLYALQQGAAGPVSAFSSRRAARAVPSELLYISFGSFFL